MRNESLNFLLAIQLHNLPKCTMLSLLCPPGTLSQVTFKYFIEAGYGGRGEHNRFLIQETLKKIWVPLKLLRTYILIMLATRGHILHDLIMYD